MEITQKYKDFLKTCDKEYVLINSEHYLSIISGHNDIGDIEYLKRLYQHNFNMNIKGGGNITTDQQTRYNNSKRQYGYFNIIKLKFEKSIDPKSYYYNNISVFRNKISNWCKQQGDFVLTNGLQDYHFSYDIENIKNYLYDNFKLKQDKIQQDITLKKKYPDDIILMTLKCFVDKWDIEFSSDEEKQIIKLTPKFINEIEIKNNYLNNL